MDTDIDRLLRQLRDIEDELERRIAAKGDEFRYQFQRKRVVFEREMLEQHRKVRTGLMRFVRASPIVAVMTAPVIYALVLPLALLDLAVCLFQAICFPLWGIARVRRTDYVVIDRHYLAYLNGIQKLNCVYCGYANGLIAFTREVAGRTEQYWCPIKHAHRTRTPHSRYHEFLDYGDAAAFADKLPEQRRRAGEP